MRSRTVLALCELGKPFSLSALIFLSVEWGYGLDDPTHPLQTEPSVGKAASFACTDRALGTRLLPG